MTTTRVPALTLGFHPSSHGFGWIAFESPFSVYDWGISNARGDKNAACMKKLDRLIRRLEPHTLVIEAFERRVHQRACRIVKLCRAVVACAAEQGIEVVIYTKGEIQSCFASVDARSRQEIAEAVARHLEVIGHRLPARRNAWDTEDFRMALFNATASVVTHFHLGSSRLFDDLIHS